MLANVGQHGCFTSSFLDNVVSYLFFNIMLESFIKKKGQLGYKYIVLGRDMLYLFNKNKL